MNLNEEILKNLNSLIENNFWKNFAFIFADLPTFFMPLFLVWFWLFYTFKIKNLEKKKDLLFIFYSVVLAFAWNYFIKIFADFSRPKEICGEMWKLILEKIPTDSFPSDHAAASFAFLFSLYLAWYKKIFWWFLPFVIFMNLSRIMACVHFPLDITVWWILWIFWAFFTFKFLKKVKFFENLNNFFLKIASFIKL